DTLPAYMHLLPGSVPPPDPGWDPDPGPPARLRWTILPPFPASGGPTAAITFTTTVDWGNGESFEPGSGDIAAPEGAFLFNAAQMAWDPPGPGECGVGHVSNQPATVVRRYLFWMTGDNDVLFAPKFGQPDDEIVYELTVRNVSASKTWWNVRLWDSVPGLLDPFAPNQGVEDPCVGWTMTPSGCAAAAPGWSAAGGGLLLTWTLDLPPSATLTLRWRGKLVPVAPQGSVVSNKASVMAEGSPGRVNGTGSAGAPRNFTHEANVVLRTTYVSYVGWAGDDSAFFSCAGFTYWISFYPLNKAADFALYKKWCCAAAPCDTTCSGFALNGGVSPPIDVLAGTCTGGPAVDWETGCKVERAPARFVPAAMAGAFVPSQPHQFLHKLVSNCPLLWELSTCGPKNSADADTYVGTSNLSFCGLITYTWLRVNVINYNFYDSLHVVNTDDATNTTIVAFVWNPATLGWVFYDVQDLYQGSHWG
ncbi:MAG: hypothetical protein AAB368_07705, partial [bacterium]